MKYSVNLVSIQQAGQWLHAILVVTVEFKKNFGTSTCWRRCALIDFLKCHSQEIYRLEIKSFPKSFIRCWIDEFDAVELTMDWV